MGRGIRDEARKPSGSKPSGSLKKGLSENELVSEGFFLVALDFYLNLPTHLAQSGFPFARKLGPRGCIRAVGSGPQALEAGSWGLKCHPQKAEGHFTGQRSRSEA